MKFVDVSFYSGAILISGAIISASAAAAPGPGRSEADPAVKAGAVPDLSGTYWATSYGPKIQFLGGGEPPLNEAGKKAYQENQAGLKDGTITDGARKTCLPDGIPRMLATPYPFELFRVPQGEITFIHELNHQVRIIPLNRPSPKYDDAFLNFDGHPVAHYEGDTLVIRSNGFNTQTFLDETGLPHSSTMVTTERIRKIGNQLEDVVSIHDPEMYMRDWQARYVYAQRNDVRLEDYSCGDVHRDLSSVKGVHQNR